MTVKNLLIGSTLTTVLASALWLGVVFFLDPEKAGIAGYGLFFLSFFLVVAGITTLVGFAVRRILNIRQLAAYSVRGALRQGIMLSLFFNLLLLLVRVRLYQWWVALILTVIFIVFELVFLSYDRSFARRAQPTKE